MVVNISLSDLDRGSLSVTYLVQYCRTLTGDDVLHVHISTPCRQLDWVETIDHPVIPSCAADPVCRPWRADDSADVASTAW